jgi:EPS-associated MarR family transcriptional regulator
MLSKKIKMEEDAYLRIMRLLEESPDQTQRELAENLGISLGSINYCLKSLVSKGFVKIDNFSKSRQKFGYLYILTPVGIAKKAELTRHFLKRKVCEYEALKNEIEMLEKEEKIQSCSMRY